MQSYSINLPTYPEVGNLAFNVYYNHGVANHILFVNRCRTIV